DRKGRFAVSPVRKLETEPVEEIASIRVQQPVAAISTLCADPALGLERSVRLRVFAVREELVNPLLDVDTTEDERWGEILDASGFLLSTTYGLRSLQVRTRRLSPSEIKSRLIRRLVQRGA
ncbi:MAG TPA: hypothetical protein VLJ39_20840, partial [Tepidisphaeraceae bacterium]|nr:hypothetical protein [Tepidisphaeraceae bacterium]